MHKLAMALARSALVLKEAQINEDGPRYVTILARKAGIFAWILSLLGVDATTTFEVYENRIECSQSTLSGKVKEMVPMSQISNLGTGLMKPVIYLVYAFICFVLLLPTFGASIIPMIIFIVLYFIRKNTTMIYALSNSGTGPILIVKRSLIENVNITEEDSNRIVNIITQLVERSHSR